MIQPNSCQSQMPLQNFYVLIIFFLWKEQFSELSEGHFLTTGLRERGESPRKGLLGGPSRQGAPGSLPTIHSTTFNSAPKLNYVLYQGLGTQR